MHDLCDLHDRECNREQINAPFRPFLFSQCEENGIGNIKNIPGFFDCKLASAGFTELGNE